MALWAPAFDKRIIASVSHCGCVNYKDSFAAKTGIQSTAMAHDACTNMPVPHFATVPSPSSMTANMSSRRKCENTHTVS